MRIKRLQLKNGYKRFHDVTIDLGDKPKRIIALVGANGSGKSSILDALLFHNRAYGRIGNKIEKNYFYHSLHQDETYSHTNIEIEFDEGSFDIVKSKAIAAGKGNTLLSFRSPYRYNSNLKVAEVRAVDDLKTNSYGASAGTDLDDKMEENYRRLNILFNKYLKDNPETATYSSTSQKIIGDLNSALSNCLDLVVSSIGDVESAKGTLYFKKPDHPKEFEFNVLSSGEKEVVDILLDLYLRRNDYTETIFLIDEPELHINTSIQRKLLIEINKLVGPNCQIWVATHSIGFLRALQSDFKDDCQIIHFENGVKWASETKKLTPIVKTRTKWLEIFETALDDLTGLVSPKQLIYCEGRDRPGQGGIERGMDAQVFNNIFSEKYHETLFISSGGNTELDQRSEIAIALLTKVFSDIEILVLKDRDSGSGKFIDDAARKIYLNTNPKNHRILGRWEIENYLFDKEVLKKYCDLNSHLGLVFDEKAYDNRVKNISDYNIKDDLSYIKNFCEIKTNISADVFKVELSKIISSDMQVYKDLESVIFSRK